MALGDGVVWDETTPTDATLAISIDDHMRHLYKAVRSRMAMEHEFPDSQSATSEAGEHKFITFQSQGSMPTITGTQVMALYSTSGPVLVYASSGGDHVQLEGFVAGDIILSSNTAARTGWTLISTSSDNMYIKLGNVMMTTGGSAQLTGSSGAYTLQVADIPSHTHGGLHDPVSAGGDMNDHLNWGASAASVAVSDATGGGGSHKHDLTSVDNSPLFVEVGAWQKD